MDAQLEELKRLCAAASPDDWRIDYSEQMEAYRRATDPLVVSDLITRLQKALVDAERWRKGAELMMYPEFCGHDESQKTGFSWYMPTYPPTPEAFQTPEAAIDAARVQGEKG